MPFAKSESSARDLPPAKLALFVAITISLPLLLLVAAELTLRLFGWGGYPEWIREAGQLPSGETVCFVDAAASKPYFFANPERRGGSTMQTSFVMPKPADTVRIFLVGESAAQGYPQPRNLAMSSFLQAMLSDVWPGKKVEVINLGTTAVASFPLVYQVRDALEFSPDLFIFYTGNNEFFGAYGTASISASASLPAWALRLMRAARGLAVVQLVDRFVYRGADKDRTLMEEMIGQTFISADSPLREAAADNLASNLGTMLDDVRAAGVPAIVCTTASNESGLAPLGQDDVTQLQEQQKREFKQLMEAAAVAIDQGNSANAVNLLRQTVQLAPSHARAHFLLGQALLRAGQPGPARVSFLRARDLDTMPWRPISLTEQAIRQAALARGVPICDVAEIFREESPDGAPGWDLLDDHVHLSLSGQARAARAMVGAVDSLGIAPMETDRLRTDEDYATALGANMYDDYAVNRSMKLLFELSFMRRSNEQAASRFAEGCREAEARMSPAVLDAVRGWQKLPAHVAVLRPITSLVASASLREGKTREASELYAVAARQIPDYTSWYLEYVFFVLSCRQQLDGSLSESDLKFASDAVAQGRFILDHNLSGGGGAENYYTGRLLQLCGRWGDAIPFLAASRHWLRDGDLLAADQALVFSYLQTGQKAAALELVERGMAARGSLSDAYRRLRSDVEQRR